jgi:hypothetical protein
MEKEHRKIVAHICGRYVKNRCCPICGHIVDLGQPLPWECAMLGLTTPFQNAKGQAEYERSGICQGCQDNRFGKED